MKIKLLSAVLHDGHRVEAGLTINVDGESAEHLIGLGLAEAVEEAVTPPAVPPAAEDGVAPNQGRSVVDQASGAPEITPAAPPATSPEAGDMPAAPEPKPAEAEPAKAKREGK